MNSALPLLLLLQPSWTAEKEQALAKGILSELRRQAVPYENPEAGAYLTRMGSKLTSEPYTFELIRNPAFEEPASVPGGYIVVPVQFFQLTQDESEFAAMLAHAIAHLSQRHYVRSKSGTIPLYFPVHSGPISLLPLPLRKEHQALELKADQEALQILAKAGLNPHALRRYVARTPLSEPSRLEALDRQLSALPNNEIPATDEFPRIQASVIQSLSQKGQKKPPTLRRP